MTLRITHQQIVTDNVGTESRTRTSCPCHFLQIKHIYAPVHHTCTATYFFHRRLSSLLSIKDIYGLSKCLSKKHNRPFTLKSYDTPLFWRTTDNSNILLVASPFAFDFMPPGMISFISHVYLFSKFKEHSWAHQKQQPVWAGTPPVEPWKHCRLSDIGAFEIW